MRASKRRLIVTFLTPAVLLYAVFVLWPYLQAVAGSLTRWRGYSPAREFIGLQNFEKVLADPAFWNAVSHNLFLLTLLPVTTLGLSLMLANVLTRRRRFSAGFAFIFFLPQVMASVLIGILWAFMYHPSIGVLNESLSAVGLEGLRRIWLGEPETALPAIAVVAVWALAGFYVVYFRAAMSAIPASYYEAATLDGANEWHLFRHVTIPLITSAIQVALVQLVIVSFGFFELVRVMTNGGPARSTEVLSTFLLRKAFDEGQFGYATAIGVTLLLWTVIAAAISFRLTRREQAEY